MKIGRTLKGLLVAAVLALSLFAMRGTAWADSAGVSWEQIPVDPTGVSWDGTGLAF